MHFASSKTGGNHLRTRQIGLKKVPKWLISSVMRLSRSLQRRSKANAACLMEIATHLLTIRTSSSTKVGHPALRPPHGLSIQTARAAFYTSSAMSVGIGGGESRSRKAAWKDESGAIRKICFRHGSFTTAGINCTGVVTIWPHRRIGYSNQRELLTATITSMPLASVSILMCQVMQYRCADTGTSI